MSQKKVIFDVFYYFFFEPFAFTWWRLLRNTKRHIYFTTFALMDVDVDTFVN